MSPDNKKKQSATRLEFQVGEDLGELFARFSGDRNPLHIDEQFARRSKYRQRIAHGMLQLMFLPWSPALQNEKGMSRIVGISGRFVGPVLYGGKLYLLESGRTASPEGSSVEITFEFRHVEGDTLAATAAVTLADGEPVGAAFESDAFAEMQYGLLAEEIDLHRGDVDRFTKGDRAEIKLHLRDDSIRAMAHAIESSILDGAKTAPWGSHARSIALASMLSTLVGMRFPGESATFLEYAIEFAEEPAASADYALDAEVVHVSNAARLLKTSFSITHGSHGERGVTAKGFVTAQVDQPPVVMPSAERLAAEFVDLGLRRKVALVTGSSRGIGETVAKHLSLLGCRVVVNCLSGVADAERVVAEIEAAGGEAVAIQADVRCENDVLAMVARIEQHFGALDILVNSAVKDFRTVRLDDLSWDQVQGDIDVNVKGAFNCCKAAIPLMRAARQGKIVNLSSIAAEFPPPDQLKYVVAKSALIGLTRSLAVELAASNIQVNAVVPNFVETDLVSHVHDGFRQQIANDIPMKRLASPGEIAQAVTFLCSSYSNYMTGQKLVVTGGAAPLL